MFFLLFYIYILFLGIVFYAIRKRDCKLGFYILALISAMGILKFSIFTYLYFVKNKNICDTMDILMECNQRKNKN